MARTKMTIDFGPALPDGPQKRNWIPAAEAAAARVAANNPPPAVEKETVTLYPSIPVLAVALAVCETWAFAILGQAMGWIGETYHVGGTWPAWTLAFGTLIIGNIVGLFVLGKATEIQA